MKTVSLFKKHGALNSLPVFRAVEYSLTTLGFRVVDNQTDADVAVIWSNLWHGRMYENRNIWNYFKSQNKPVIILEVGSVKRGTTWRIGLNGIKPKNLIYETRAVDNQGLFLKDWRAKGDYILICGQHDKSNFWENMPKQELWIENCIHTIRNYTDMTIVVRPHPRCPIKPLKLKNVEYLIPNKIPDTYDEFDLNFENCHSVVSWSGSAGPHAVISGVPVFCGPDSFAAPVGNLDLNNILSPTMPDRSEWFEQFLSSEYTLSDIKLGMPLKTLTNYI